MARDEMKEMKGDVAEIINLFCERGPQIIPDLTDPKIERKLGKINSRFRSWCIDFGLSRSGNACGDLMVQKDIREAQTVRRLTQHLKNDLGNCYDILCGQRLPFEQENANDDYDVASDTDSDENWDEGPTDELSIRFSSLERTMNNLERLMLLTYRPTIEGAITAVRSNNEDDRAPSNTADDMILCRRMMQASIDRRKLIPEKKSNCSHEDILQGLRPYHCTYSNCSTGSKLYHSRSDWMEHEKIAHQQLWQCRDHHDFSCHSRDAFERHLMEEHRSLKEIHRKAWMDIYKPVTEDKRRHCPICLASTEQLLHQSLAKHVAGHLEQFASRASDCEVPEARLQLLQLFDGSQSRQEPCSHPTPAQAPMLDLMYDRLKVQTVTNNPRDRIYGMLGISDIDDGPAGRTKRSKAEDRNDDIKREATCDGSAVDIRTQQLPPTRHDPSMLEHQSGNPPEPNRGLQQMRPTWHQPDLYSPPGEPYLHGPSLLPRASLSGFRSPPVGACARATSAAPAHFSPFPNSTQSFADGSIKDCGPASVADDERVPWGLETHASSLAYREAAGSTSRPEQTNGSDPSKTGEPPSGRPSPSPSSHRAQYRATSPAALEPDIVRSGGEASYNPPPSLHMRINLGWRFSQTYMHLPEPARHEESGTPLEPVASVASILQNPLLNGIRDQPTGTSQRDRHRISIDTGRARRYPASSLTRQLNPRTTWVKFAPPPVNQRRDSTSQENWSMSRFSRIAKPMPPNGILAENPLVGNRPPGVNIQSDQAISPLFPEFKLQPHRFFKIGKVFSVLWSDSTGQHSTATSWIPVAAVNDFGERAFSRLRRFIVIRESGSHCHALPIRTYGGRGVASPGVNKSDHCIVYTGDPAPQARWDEHPRPGESGMRPIAIRIDPETPAEQLDEMSRIDLCGITRIEHDAMVGSYGQVNRQSMPELLRELRVVWSFHAAFDEVGHDDEEWILLRDSDGDDDERMRGIDDDEDEAEDDEDDEDEAEDKR